MSRGGRNLPRYIVGFTGASGIVYGVRLVEELLKREFEVNLIISQPAAIVLQQEMGWEIDDDIPASVRKYFGADKLTVYENSNIAAPIASGSYLTEGMVVIPCTMASISAIATGAAKGLLERAADVMIKEKRNLIVVPRETPLNAIHLRNMLTLAELGVHVVPAMPGFYSHPQTVDDLVNFIIGKVLDSMRIEHNLFARYEG
ncbi:MAG: UbiX family flavin prenyltransferase [Syntrophomonadaceae bacterium]|nr:UbiX family flavin prenyltransferase [Syntrophomonadaceae bacterium]